MFGFRQSLRQRFAPPVRPRSFSVESLESRELFSVEGTNALLDLTAMHTNSSSGALVIDSTPTLRLATTATTLAAPTLPLVRRNYLGDAFDHKNVKLALVVKIRKQDNRGTYASLRGDIRLATPEPNIYFMSITYGKLRTNLHVDFQFSGNGMTGTISGKVSSSGSQIKGNYSTTGTYNSSGTFVIKKVVGIG